MRKLNYLLIVYVCFITIISVSCTNNRTTVSPSSSNLNSDTIEEGKNYKIIVSKKAERIEYRGLVYDNKGSVMYDETLLKKSDFSYLESDILQNHNGSGNVSQYQFFQVDESLKSPIYENPSLIENRKIVYMTLEGGKIKLIVSDLFDKSKFYKEYNRDFSPVAAPYNDLISAKFIDSNKLQVTYLSGSSFKKVEELIGLD